MHEYGGGAFVIANRAIYFSNFSDQRIYAVGHTTDRELEVPHPITPAGDWFYADAAFDAARQRLICVREDHGGGRRTRDDAREYSPRRYGERRRGDRIRFRLLLHAAAQRIDNISDGRG